MLLTSPSEALALCIRIGAIGVTLASLEVVARPGQLEPGGILGAGTQVYRARWSEPFAWLAPFPMGIGLMAIRIGAALAVLIFADRHLVAALGTSTIAVTTFLLRIRSPLGIHASGAMSTLTMAAAALGLDVGTRAAMEASLAFIAAESALAYLVAGSSKMRTQSWRSGRALPALASTATWGRRREAMFLRSHERVALVLCWATMAGECLVPVSLALPLPFTIAALCCAGAFHIAVGIEMGINSFVWAFGSTYPALLFAWYGLHGHI